MSRLVFLGTGAALPTAERGNTALAISGPDPDQWLQIDCGDGAYRGLLRAGIAANSVRDLLITHAHIDHIGALPSLIESFRLDGRTAPLRVWGLAEVIEIARRILSDFSYELTLDTWPFTIALNVLQPGENLTLAGIPVRAARMDHALPSVGVRLGMPTGAVCYTCDTQPCDAVAELGRDADLLITECTFLQRDEAFARRSKHLTAVEAGQQATRAQAQALALVHLGVGDGWTTDEALDEATSAYTGRILIPNDGDEMAV